MRILVLRPLLYTTSTLKGGNIIKTFAREIDSDQSLYRYSRYRGNELENYGYVINAYQMFDLENTACLSTFVKLNLYN